MSGDNSKLVGCVSHDSPPKRLKEDVEKMRFKFHNFASLENARCEDILTPAIEAHGYPWKLRVYPRGSTYSPKDVEYVSVYLRYAGDNEEKLAVKFSIRCNALKESIADIHTFEGKNGHGLPDYLKRKDALETYLDEDGTLLLDVDLQIAVEKEDI